MNKLRNVSIALLLTFAGGIGLTACGGETPATATLPPPTATSVPPTATSVPPTATTVSSAGAVPTTGDTGASATSAPLSADMSLVTNAVSATEKLNSYHFVLSASGSAITQTVAAEGDYIGPDSSYVKGTIGSQQVEEIIVNNKAYTKDASGNWVEQVDTSSSSTGFINPKDIVGTANPLADISQLVDAGSDLKLVGEESVNGKSTKHYTFVLDAQKMALGQSGQPLPSQLGANIPSIGGGAVWVDADGKYVERLEMNIDMGPLMQMLADLGAAFSGTPTPGGPAPTAIPSQTINFRIDISRQNDPSLKLPAMPAGAAHATPTETPEPLPAGSTGESATATAQP